MMLQIKFHSNQPTGGGVRVLRRENSQKQKNQGRRGGGGSGRIGGCSRWGVRVDVKYRELKFL